MENNNNNNNNIINKYEIFAQSKSKQIWTEMYKKKYSDNETDFNDIEFLKYSLEKIDNKNNNNS